MGESQLDKKVLVVAGMTSEKKVIKFEGDEAWHVIAENVKKLDLVKFGIKPKAVVDVTFNEKGEVVFLKKKKDGGATTETKSEAPKETVSSEVKEWTIKAIAKNQKVIKFEESTKDWEVTSPEVEKMDLKALGIVVKAKVYVTLDGEGIVTAISVATPTEEEVKAPGGEDVYSESNSTRSTSDSIERQVALKESGDIVRTLIEMAREETDDILKIKILLKDLTKTAMESLNQ